MAGVPRLAHHEAAQAGQVPLFCSSTLGGRSMHAAAFRLGRRGRDAERRAHCRDGETCCPSRHSPLVCTIGTRGRIRARMHTRARELLTLPAHSDGVADGAVVRKACWATPRVAIRPVEHPRASAEEFCLRQLDSSQKRTTQTRTLHKLGASCRPSHTLCSSRSVHLLRCR